MKHLTVDLKAPAENLSDSLYLEAVLEELRERIGMSQLLEPVMVEVPNGSESGVTGALLIKESHITIHTWPEFNHAAIDVFSCKDFDTNEAVRYVQRALKPWCVKLTEIKRMEL